MFCPCKQGAIIYLRFHVPGRFISRFRIPLPKFGFLTYGVYIVPLLPFPEELRHCCTLWFSTMDCSLGVVTAVIAWPYLLNQHNRYCHRRQCEHGLSSTLSGSDCLVSYLRLNTSCSSLAMRRRMSTCERLATTGAGCSLAFLVSASFRRASRSRTFVFRVSTVC